MAEERQLKLPPPQTVPGVVLYHENPALDNRCRDVRRLYEAGHDMDVICDAVERSRRSVMLYFRQIRKAQMAYIEAFPEEFDSGMQGLRRAIQERRQLSDMLRRELASIGDTNASNKVGVYKLIMRNKRETEELTGLLISRIEHGGAIEVKDSIRSALDAAPPELREKFLDALTAIVSTAESSVTESHPDRGE